MAISTLKNSIKSEKPSNAGTGKSARSKVAEISRFPESRHTPAADPGRIARAAAGDAGAWSALVNRHLPAVTRCAAYMLGDHTEAEDVAQDTFVRLHRKLDSWEGGEDGLSSWLHRVAVNLSIDRKRAPARPVSLVEIGDVSEPAGLDGPLDRKRHVEAALAGLPDRQRAALVLVHYQGLSGREAASALEISVEALESLLARARRTLRNTLAPVRADLLGAHHD
ncbi:MAG: sigma-70 family RNA polymerase sigma factor [Sphingomonadaceae bacterium]|nr:sigma-70 family RNA polymerase sigma factor [Alphaproteobacteria bacterium]RZV45955.1 MAG: sigma-70 family RNA polymerase sigma factor [Sphingomonadaceae bacterium]